MVKTSFNSQHEYIHFSFLFYREQGFSSVSEAVGADHRGADGLTHKPSPLKETVNVNTNAVPVAAVSPN